MKKLDKKALKKSLFSSLSRTIGVILATGAGSLLKHLAGNGLSSWGIALAMAILAFVAILVAEYEREIS